MKPGEKRFDVLLVVRLDLVGVTRLPQVLHAAGCRVTLLAPAGLAIGRSRFIDRRVIAPSTIDELIGRFRAHLAERLGAYRWVIVADEPLLHEIARQRGAPWLDGWFPVDHRSRAVDLITSKHDFMQVMSEAGLPVPRFQICRDLAEARPAAEHFGYPVVLKASSGWAGSGVRVVATPGELPPQFEQIAGGQPVAVQEFARGMLGQTEVLFDRGTPTCWVSSYTLQSWPTNLAASCVRQVMDHRHIEPLITGIGALIGFHGLGGVDWIHDPVTDAIGLIEFNPRPTPAYHTGHLAGVDFSAGIRAMLSGTHAVQRPRQAERSPKVFLFPQSVYRAVDDRDLRMLGHALADVPWNDPPLVAAHLRRVCGHYTPRAARRWVKRLLGRPADCDAPA